MQQAERAAQTLSGARSVANPGLYTGPVNSFTTPPAVGASSTLRYIAWADSGQAYNDGAPTLGISVHA